MGEYRAPLEDIGFVLEHIVGLADLAALPGFESADPELVAGLLEEAGKFMSEVLSPLNRTADLEKPMRSSPRRAGARSGSTPSTVAEGCRVRSQSSFRRWWPPRT